MFSHLSLNIIKIINFTTDISREKENEDVDI